MFSCLILLVNFENNMHNREIIPFSLYVDTYHFNVMATLTITIYPALIEAKKAAQRAAFATTH